MITTLSKMITFIIYFFVEREEGCFAYQKVTFYNFPPLNKILKMVT